MNPRLEAVVKKWQDLAKKVAPRYAITPELVLAIICQESSGIETATRHEPSYRYLWFPREVADRNLRTYEKECQEQMTSWGLMQIMGAVVREQGYEKSCEDLLSDPDLGLRHACQHLSSYVRRYGEETDWISAYNQGSPRKTAGRLYLNQKTYVDPVCGYLRELRQVD